MSRSLDLIRDVSARAVRANRLDDLNATLCARCQRQIYGPIGIACPGPAEIDGRDAREVCSCGCHDY